LLVVEQVDLNIMVVEVVQEDIVHQDMAQVHFKVVHKN
jgi:hypothetical protein|tara:strand:+ start:67 stop:180 length:114 start_codon:yes stop_codon:yes gene_type:complete